VRSIAKSEKFSVRAPRPLFAEDYGVLVEHLREATQRSGYSQVEIAQRLNKTPVYLSKVLNQRQVMTLIEVRDICRAADIPFTEWIKDLDRELDRRRE